MLGPYALGPNDDNQGIYTGDARLLAEAIPDESVDLIFTDPVYDQVQDYGLLARIAGRVLKPSGALLVWSNGHWHRRNTAWLEKAGMTYRWDFAVVNLNVSAPMDGHVIAKTNRLIWLDADKGSKMRTYLPDGYGSVGGAWEIDRLDFHWSKSPAFTRLCVECFSASDGVVFDPFCGGGTVPAVCKMLGRRWLAFEIDPDTAERGRQRVYNTQAPLFVPEPEQIALEMR